jgi:hypothetical protein
MRPGPRDSSMNTLGRNRWRKDVFKNKRAMQSGWWSKKLGMERSASSGRLCMVGAWERRWRSASSGVGYPPSSQHFCYNVRPQAPLYGNHMFVGRQEEVLSEAVEARVSRKVVRSCTFIFYIGHRIAARSGRCLLVKIKFTPRVVRVQEFRKQRELALLCCI